MHTSHPSWYRSGLAFLRLLLVFAAFCLILNQLDYAYRLVRDQTIGQQDSTTSSNLLPSPSTLPFLGINADLASLASEHQVPSLGELRAAGFGWVRLRLAWDQVEPIAGEFDWSSTDRAVKALIDANLVPVLVLDGSPQWARAPTEDADNPFAPPAAPHTFARFAEAVAMRYGDRVDYYQIWDEPNIAPHWGTQHIEAASYARLLKATATIIRNIDPEAFILLAALAPTADRGHLAQDEVYFLNRLYAAGAAPYFDAVAIEPFGFAARPDDLAVDRSTLNFRRTLWIRQAMLAAKDGDTPIWIVRYGWNRLPSPLWKHVTAENQSQFAIAALQMAYTEWPWVMAQGWAVAFPPEPRDTTAGLALTPQLAEAFQERSTELDTQPRPLPTSTATLVLWRPIVFWLLAAVLLLWRGSVAATKLPWCKWQTMWTNRPAWQQACGWAALLLIYYLAAWPPLILLCWVVAALGFMAQPRVGLALTLVLLPFHDYHKELTWLDQRWNIPPAQAALICLLPAMWLHRPKKLPRDRWLVMAASWVLVMALSATGTWYWPAYWRAFFDLVISPVLLFLLIRVWVTTRQQTYIFIAMLATGGLLAAVFGLIGWLQGDGTLADGLRRLTGPTFSPNQTALYLTRTLAITIGLALAVPCRDQSKAQVRTQKRAQWGWSVVACVVALALLLTGSRGALLLGLPAGALILLNHRNGPLPSRRWLAGWLIVVGVGLVAVAGMWGERLANLSTLAARLEGWQVALAVWRDYIAFGVGPEGFWWRFPAYLSLTSEIDPNLRHPHNLWLEFATSGGLFALAWLLAMLLFVYRWVQSHQGSLTWPQVGLLAGLVAGLAHAQVDAFQALPDLATWNWVALALLLAPQRDPIVIR
jgi:O-antigen ligase